MSDDLFREVDEEVRQDRYIKIWKRYGIYVSALVVTIILITVGVVVWRDIERSASCSGFSGNRAQRLGGERGRRPQRRHSALQKR